MDPVPLHEQDKEAVNPLASMKSIWSRLLLFHDSDPTSPEAHGQVEASRGSWPGKWLPQMIQGNVTTEHQQLQQLVLEAPVIPEGSLDQEQLRQVLIHQQQINQITTRLTGMHGWANFLQVIRNRQLHQVMLRGQQQVNHLQQEMEQLKVDAVVQKKVAERLKQTLDMTRALLEQSMAEYRKEIQEQREILLKQQKALSELQRSKFHQDLILDGSLLAVSVYISRSSVIQYPLKLLIMLLSSRLKSFNREKRLFLRQLMQVMVIVYAFRQGRKLALSYGLHQRVGDMVSYLNFMMQWAVVAGRSAVVVGQRLLHPSRRSTSSSSSNCTVTTTSLQPIQSS